MNFNVPKISDEGTQVNTPTFKLPSASQEEVSMRRIVVDVPNITNEAPIVKMPLLFVPIKDICLSPSGITVPIILSPKVVCCGDSLIINKDYIYHYNIVEVLWKGEYKSTSFYLEGNQVRFLMGDTVNAYIALKPVPIGISPLNTEYWDLHVTGLSIGLGNRVLEVESIVSSLLTYMEYLATKQEVQRVQEQLNLVKEDVAKLDNDIVVVVQEINNINQNILNVSTEIENVYDTIQNITNIVEGGGLDKNNTYYQNTPALEWTITHNLNKFPSVELIDSYGNKFLTKIRYLNTNQLIVVNNRPKGGIATCN